jgi:hypothetical protein
MIPVFAVLNLIVCSIGLMVGVRAMRVGKTALLPIYLLVYTLTNGVGSSFAFLPQMNSLIWNSMYDTLVRPVDYVTLCTSTWIFIGIASLLIHWGSAYRPSKPRAFSELAADLSLTVSLGLLFVGVALYIKYMILGPGLTMARETSYFHYDVDAEYQFRQEFDAQMQHGQGMLMASVASFVIFPLSTFFAVLNKRAMALVIAVGSFCFLCSFAFSFALRQKAPVLLILLIYGLLYMHYASRSLLTTLVKRLTDKRILIAGMLLFLCGLSFFYEITEGESLQESVVHSFYRIFLIPVASDQAWFLVFPNILPYRGLVGIYDPAFWDPTATGPVGVYDVSQTVTGYEFSLNASMLAVAWSGAGYLGVVIISVLFCASAFVLDKGLIRLPSSLFYPIVIINLPSLLALTSTSFFDFLMKGGFLTQAGIIFAFRALGRLKAGGVSTSSFKGLVQPRALDARGGN